MKTVEAVAPGDLLTSQAMRELEASAIAQGRATGLRLMERAGAGVAAAIAEVWGDRVPGAAVVLCGPGNNGGDGYVVARHLVQAGWRVEVFALGDPAHLPPDALANHHRWAADAPVRPLAEAAQALGAADLVVDALFGLGLARPLAPEVRALAAAVAPAALTVAVDVPSGAPGDAVALPAAAARFPAELVVTFHAPKPAHAALAAAGARVVVVDIGL